MPDRNGEKVYALLRDALKESGRIGIAHVVLHDRQHLGALIPVGPLLALDTLRWQEELRPLDELSAPAGDARRAGVTARELGMAKKLIDDMSGDWTPEQYRDTFRDDILALVERKVRSGKIEEIGAQPAETARAAANVVDLTELLKRSLRRGADQGGEAATARDGGAPRARPRTPAKKAAAKRTSAKTAAGRARTTRSAAKKAASSHRKRAA